MKLILGKSYDAPTVAARFIGWSASDNALTVSLDGYALEHYFDAEGRYLGPDADGVEPVFEPVFGVAPDGR